MNLVSDSWSTPLKNISAQTKANKFFYSAHKSNRKRNKNEIFERKNFHKNTSQVS